MAGGLPAANTLILLARRLLSWFSPEWIAVFSSLYHSLRHALTPGAEQGMYEILDYDATLDLKDIKGKTAVFKRRQRVKFLQDHIIAFQDHAWGDGKIFADYKISKGFAVDRYREGDRWNVLISLRETQSRGDIEDFYIERTVKNGFIQKEEWWQVEVWHKTRRLRLTLLFPKRRHCKRAVLHTRGGNKTVVLDRQHFHSLPNGRQLLRWEAKNPRRAEVYTNRTVKLQLMSTESPSDPFGTFYNFTLRSV